ncbi:MAG: hypothetical protein IPM77_12540 [Crocinitomicaceae bacterium]|nr:hypothetical protein [Crocinitomicaceae bacterium]
MDQELIDQIPENENTESHQLPKSFNALATFAYLGNGFWGIVFMTFFFLVVSGSNALYSAFRIKFENEALVAFIYLIALILCVIPIVGVYKMSKQNKSGFSQYAITNGIWILYCVILQNPVTIMFGLLSAAFIYMFYTFLKYMK